MYDEREVERRCAALAAKWDTKAMVHSQPVDEAPIIASSIDGGDDNEPWPEPQTLTQAVVGFNARISRFREEMHSMTSAAERIRDFGPTPFGWAGLGHTTAGFPRSGAVVGSRGSRPDRYDDNVDDSLVAAGGWCAPSEVIYDASLLETEDYWQARRNGVSYQFSETLDIPIRFITDTGNPRDDNK